MTSQLITRTEAQAESGEILASLCTALPLVSGALLASADGHPLASNLDSSREKSSAAIVASSFALGQRLAEIGGSSEVQEMLVRHGDGYVAIYAVGSDAALVVVTMQNVNLGMLKLKAAHTISALEPLVPALFTRGVQ